MKRISMVLGSLLLSSGLWAATADQISVVDPYVRLAPPNAMATGGFMVLKNAGDKDAKVVKADNPVSKSTELHTHLNENGVMKMRPVSAVDIKAKGETVLKPGSLHVMLIEMKKPLKEGEIVPITLTFEDGSIKKVDAVVRPIQVDVGKSHGHQH